MIFIESRKKSSNTLGKNYPNAEVIDLTSKAKEPFVKFSPFYPHGNIPVPFSPDTYAASVEGIWQGLKVFQKEDIDTSKFEINNMKGLKRSVRKFGYPLGHRQGINGQLLDYLTARKQIYLPTYTWVLQNKLTELIELLNEKARTNDLIFLDFETNGTIDNISKPLSHAALVKYYLENKYPELTLTRFTQLGQIQTLQPSKATTKNTEKQATAKQQTTKKRKSSAKQMILDFD